MKAPVQLHQLAKMGFARAAYDRAHVSAPGSIDLRLTSTAAMSRQDLDPIFSAQVFGG